MSDANSEQKNQQPTNPIERRSEVKDSHDKHITQDFNNFPDLPAAEKQIKPETPTEKKTAAIDVKDGEKQLEADAESRETEKTNEQGKSDQTEQDSDGSANAF